MFIEVIHILTLIVYVYLAISTLYFLLFATAGRFVKRVRFSSNDHKNKIALLIPAYREDDIIVDTVQKACGHNYPEGLFQVIVIADSLESQTVGELRRTGALVLEVSFSTSTKARSLHAALQFLPKIEFDIAVVLDSDNIMADGCLEKINDAFCHGRKSVQCHRVAKNENSPVAMLGAVSEEININLFRRGQAALGFSVAPLGSGMAFEFAFLKEIFSREEVLASAGEDREIDIQLFKKKIFMDFIDDACIYDEKPANTRVFEKQRIRWFEAQWNHARRFFGQDMAAEPRTIAYYNKLFQTIILPRLFYFTVYGIVLIAFTLSWFFKVDLIIPSFGWWLVCLSIYVFVLTICIPPRFFNLKLLKSLLYIPVLMISMLRAVFKMKKNRKGFLHTSKTFVDK